ncbi:hypothetical protein DQ04_00121060 [Trypanosoma grayi]|uniref:hypothetical protein n=1 Tax=Trypanosoma grayi TaxID=71804 RepID=UPI0004F46CCC|nr:hypothetical protein DQ04_00121060 [Trypanosoma grayi]KEG15274.1 hypothetical protein DQ04_00121060 [Trypanosoma grayi]
MSDSDSDTYDPAEVSGTKVAHNMDAVAVAATTKHDDGSAPSSSPQVSATSTTTAPTTSHPVMNTTTAAGTPSSGTTELASSLTSTGYTLRGVSGRVRSACLSPLGSTLCAAGEGGTLCMWDFSVPLESRAVKPTRILTPFPNRISGFQPIVSVHSASDGAYFVACQDGDCPALIAASGKQLGYCAMGQRGVVDVVQCKGHRAPVTCSAPSPGMASRFFTGSQDSTARIWDTASFDRQSVYAVKHGSGQLLENVVVEAVVPLLSATGDKTSVFATGGEDGLVQLWDARQKYRPGGVIGVLDVYSSKAGAGSSLKASNNDSFFEEKHVGGMAEPDSSRPMLCVRYGSNVRVLDLRKMGKNGIVEDVCPPLTDLPFSTDTTPLIPCTSTLFSEGKPSFMTCTSRAGYRHIAGGHVVQFTYIEGSYQPAMVWRPGTAEDNVLAIAVDVQQGQLFAGMHSGDVIGRVRRLGVDLAGSAPTMQTWLSSRPEREERVVGKKSRRGEADLDDEAVF